VKLLPGGPCVCCGARLSPQWRKPVLQDEVKVLCNACGIYFTRHKTLPFGRRGVSVQAVHARSAFQYQGQMLHLLAERVLLNPLDFAIACV
jgi:hypothetical protein